jgi:hypothetical protein
MHGIGNRPTEVLRDNEGSFIAYCLEFVNTTPMLENEEFEPKTKDWQ